MIVQESPVGLFVKGGERFVVSREPGSSDDPQAWAEQNGYAFSPLSRASQPASYTAQRWIESQGYSALMVVALMDLERKAAEAGASSAKLTAVRAWFDSLMTAYAADQKPRAAWATAPHSFAEVAAEVAVALAG